METYSWLNLRNLFLFSALLPLIGAFRLHRNLRTHEADQIQMTRTFNELEYDIDYDTYDFEPPKPKEVAEEKHPCQRTCVKGKPLTCRYQFNIEYYSTMSKACYDCPYNVTDCNLPQCIAGDGMPRTVLVVNRKLPGPSIDVCLGDTVEVELVNQMLDVSTSVHWHGLFQKKTPFMDGVPFVSQCLIEPQSSFLYRFFADNPGTHLWHSHSALQRGDGIYGSLIIRVPPGADSHATLYDYDLPEHVVTILDWNHMLSVNKFVSHYHSKGDNKPPSILVNGKGRYKEFVKDNEVIFTPAEKFTVTKDKRYRFRVINAGFLNCPIEISIDKHNITVIASDGGNLKPVETPTLVTAAGERFDFVLTANQPVGNYWMRFTGLLDCKVKKAFQVAILHYKGANEEDPEGDVFYDNSISTGFKVNAVNTPANTKNALIMSELPADGEDHDPALKPVPDVKFYLAYDFYPVENIHYKYPAFDEGFNGALLQSKARTPQINHISMQFPNFPVMADLVKTKSLDLCNVSSISMDCRFKFCECPHVLTVPLNAVVELVLIDEGVPFEANHPFHLHGYSFRLLGMDRLGNSTSEEEVRSLDDKGLLKRNFNRPPKKDTITIPDGGYAVVRFHATNPGFWILHCHLDFHVEMGMALLFKVGEDKDFVPPPHDLPMCGDPFKPVPVNMSSSFSAHVHPVPGTPGLRDHPSSAGTASTVWLLLLLSSSLHLTFLR